MLYLRITPLQDCIGQPTSTLFVTSTMTHGGLYAGVNPGTTPVSQLVEPLVGAIDDYAHVFAEGVDLRVYVDPLNRAGLWAPVIAALRERYEH